MSESTNLVTHTCTKFRRFLRNDLSNPNVYRFRWRDRWKFYYSNALFFFLFFSPTVPLFYPPTIKHPLVLVYLIICSYGDSSRKPQSYSLVELDCRLQVRIFQKLVLTSQSERLKIYLIMLFFKLNLFDRFCFFLKVMFVYINDYHIKSTSYNG